jgi:hypothetical protein
MIGGMAILPTPVLGFLWMLLLRQFGEQQHGRDRLVVWVCAACTLAIYCKGIAVDSVEEIPVFAKIDTSHDGAFCADSLYWTQLFVLTLTEALTDCLVDCAPQLLAVATPTVSQDTSTRRR